MSDRRKAALALAFGTLLVYARVAELGFVEFDDTKYLHRNAKLQQGLGLETLRWAFTTTYFQNYHPLTWLSYALDFELFGLSPLGYHLENALLHALAALLLFGLLERTTGRAWRSAFAAGLFALHPLHVESVAWISQRKDLLAACLGFGCAHAWVGYTRAGGVARYAAAALLLALGLLAKPVLVTWPLVLLLLDRWPLGRTAASGPAGASWRRLLLEKVPLLALSAATAGVTLAAQAGAGALEIARELPLALRAANALVGAAAYLVQTVWPAELCVLYPHPYLAGGIPLSAAEILGSGALLAAISALVLRFRRTGYAVLGWIWYLVVLLPNSGLVQVGMQSRADRYSYLPLVGIFAIAAFGGADLLVGVVRGAAARRRAAAALGLGILSACALQTFRQIGTWRDSVTLFEHALASTRDNWVIHYDLAGVLQAEGRSEEAIAHYREALRIVPDRADATFNLAMALAAAGRADEAEASIRRSVELDPDHPKARRALAKRLAATGRLAEALPHWAEAVRTAPRNPRVRAEYAAALAALGRLGEAEAELRLALERARETGDAELLARLRAGLPEAAGPAAEAAEPETR
jgi:tetratricopeptide (TPR) repeat protein